MHLSPRRREFKFLDRRCVCKERKTKRKNLLFLDVTDMQKTQQFFRVKKK